MKAILIVDEMPKRCLDCQLIWDEINNGIVRCTNGSMLNNNDIFKEKPNWCPLRPLPTDILGAYVNSFAEDYISFTEGWDSYEKALMGETE